MINKGLIKTCHDLSDGGLLLGLAEVLIKNNQGAEISLPSKKISDTRWFFSEDQSRYLVITNQKEKLIKIAKSKNVTIILIGKVKGKSLNVKKCFEISLKDLININKKWFLNYNK